MNQSAIGLVQLISDLWPIFTGFIISIIWFIRLEAKVLFLKENHKDHVDAVTRKDAALWAKVDSLQTSITNVLQGVARLEGKMDSHRQD